MKLLDVSYINLFYLLGIPLLLYIIGKFVLKKTYVPFVYVRKSDRKYLGFKLINILDLIGDLFIIFFSVLYINRFVLAGNTPFIQNILIIDTTPSVCFPSYRLDSVKRIVKSDRNSVIITTDGRYNNMDVSPYFFPSLSLVMVENYPLKNNWKYTITLYSDNNWFLSSVDFKRIFPSFEGYINPFLKEGKLELKGSGKLIVERDGIVIIEKNVGKDTIITIPSGDTVLIGFNGDSLYVVGDRNVELFTDEKDYSILIEKILSSMDMDLRTKRVKKGFVIDGFKVVCDTSDSRDNVVINGKKLNVYRVHHTLPRGEVLLWSESGYPLIEVLNDTILFHFCISPSAGGFVITPYYMKLWHEIVNKVLKKGERVLFLINGKEVSIKEHPPFFSENGYIYRGSNLISQSYHKPIWIYLIVVLLIAFIKFRMFI